MRNLSIALCLALAPSVRAEPEEPARRTITPQMVGREEFEQTKKFFRPGGPAASKSPPPTVIDHEPLPRAMTAAELAPALKRLEHAFFVSSPFSRAKIEGDVAFLPGLQDLRVKWTRVVDVTGRNVLRAPNAKEREHDRIFNQSELSTSKDGPVYSAELSIDEAERLVRAEGDATVVLTGELFAFEMSCAKLGVPVRLAGQTMTLRRCDNDVAQVDWELPETGPMPKVTSVLRDAQGRRLRVGESGGEGVLADGRTLAQVEYKELPVTMTTERMYYVAQGKVASVTVLVSGRPIQKTMHVIATSEPRFDDGKPVRIEASRFAPPPREGFGVVKADVAELKAHTRVVLGRVDALAERDQHEITIELPAHDNSAYATLMFDPVRLTSASGAEVPHRQETTWVSFPERTETVYLKPPKKAGDRASLEFARARGVVKVHYPVVIEDTTLTKAKAAASGYRARFDGARVFVAQASPFDDQETSGQDSSGDRDDDEDERRGLGKRPSKNLEVPSFAPAELDLVQGFDAQGNRLRRFDNFTGWKDGWSEYRFWGNVARIVVRRCTTWGDYEIPFDLTPAAPLPKSPVTLVPLPAGQ